MKSDKNVQSVSSFLTNSLDLLKSSHSTIKSISNGKAEDNLNICHNLQVTVKRVKLEPEKIMDMKMYEIENEELPNDDCDIGMDYYSSNEDFNYDDEETTIKEEFKPKDSKLEKRKSVKIKKTKKSSKLSIKKVKTDSLSDEDKKTIIEENMKINSSENKQYQCHRCAYSTNSEARVFILYINRVPQKYKHLLLLFRGQGLFTMKK